MIDRLEEYDAALAAGDEGRMAALLREGREIKTELDREDME